MIGIIVIPKKKQIRRSGCRRIVWEQCVKKKLNFEGNCFLYGIFKYMERK